MTNEFFAELARCLQKKEIDSEIQKDRRLEVILHGQPALFVTPRNEVFLLPEMSGSEEANELYHEVAQAADEVFSYVEAVQTAPPPARQRIERGVPPISRLWRRSVGWSATRKWIWLPVCHLDLGLWPHRREPRTLCMRLQLA